MCRDPSCPTFALRTAQAQMMAASSLLPPGYPPSPYSHLSPYHSLPGMLPPSLLPPSMAPPPPHLQPPPPTTSVPTSSSSPASLGTSPYLCSWMQGRDFCGRRFNSSEELMSHLRSHTANMGEGAGQAGAGAGAAPQTPALALLQAQAAQMRSHQQQQASPTNTSSPTPPSSSPSLSLPPHLQLLASSSSSLPPHLLPIYSTAGSSPSSRYLEAAVAASSSRYHPYGRGQPSISAQELQGLASLGRPHLPPSFPPHLLSSLYGAPRPSLPVLP